MNLLEGERALTLLTPDSIRSTAWARSHTTPSAARAGTVGRARGRDRPSTYLPFLRLRYQARPRLGGRDARHTDGEGPTGAPLWVSSLHSDAQRPRCDRVQPKPRVGWLGQLGERLLVGRLLVQRLFVHRVAQPRRRQLGRRRRGRLILTVAAALLYGQALASSSGRRPHGRSAHCSSRAAASRWP